LEVKAQTVGWWLLLLLAALAGLPVSGQEDAPDTRLYDTSAPFAARLNQESIAKRTGWRQIPEDTLPARFTGDAVVLNDKLAVVFQKQRPGPEIYSKVTGRALASTGFLSLASSASEVMTEFRIVENTAGGVRVEAKFANSGELRFRLTTGEAILEIQSPQGTGSVTVQSEARYVVVPDYFGDDMIYSSQGFSGLLPAENFCLNLLGSGEAILMTVWQSNQQEASLASARQIPNGGGCVSQIRCMKDKSIWLAFLEQPCIWHVQSGLAAEAWKPPFPAKWRSSFVRGMNVADSWDTEQGPTPEQKSGEHQGPLLTYLIDRTSATPLTASCPTDVMRNTLGVGPCQYILACEGMGSQGDPTPNSVMGWVEKQFQQKKQRKAADDIKERLGHMTQHVEEARAKIRQYAEFATQLSKLLAAKAAPGSLLALARDLDRFAAAGLTPEAAPERAQQLAGEVTALLTQENAQAACLRLGEQLRSIGSVQDRALARCRMAVRRLRQDARTLAAGQPSAAAVAQEVQRLAEQRLQSK
jgi:hypothetical protein